MQPQTRVTHTFTEQFGQSPTHLARAPGRVNLIGEHTDYNDGFVLPMAVNRAVWIALRPRQDRQVIIHALDFDSTFSFHLDALEKAPHSPVEYIKGVAWALMQQNYPLQGWEGVLAGDVPIGAGLSSSAALELATARAFQAVSGFEWDAPLMARLAQKAENDWVGMNCGIMDQMISAAGKAGHALLIDCRTLETKAAPLPPNTVAVVLDTGTRRGLVDSAYNQRRAQCEEAARFFGVPALRDVDEVTFTARANELDATIRRRARHIITENTRVLAAVNAMQTGNAPQLGQLMNASHTSLRHDFEVSSPALDTIAAIAREHPACYGARMTGAGFGGCAVALVQADAATHFAVEVKAAYEAQTPHQAQIYLCEATDGATIIT